MIAQLDASYIRIRPYKVYTRLLSYLFIEGRPLTTKGRWINPLVFAHFAIEKRLPALKKVRQPIFILGTGRSGTTVLGMVLSMHREVAFLNEPKALWHSIYSNEDLIGSYSRGVAQYRLTAGDATDGVQRSAYRLLGAYLAASFTSRVVDKYPELIFRVPFVKKIFPDAKFIFLVRNGWDTCHSIEGWSGRLGEQVGEETHDWWGVDRRKWKLLIEQIVSEHVDLAPYAESMRGWTDQTNMAAVEWIVTMREGLALLEKHPDCVMRVTYEDLCMNSQHELTRIVDFSNLAGNDDKFFRYAKNVLRATPNKLPFKLDSSIEAAFIETMSRLGYEI